MKNVSIIGAGSFGTALSVVLGHAGFKVKLWARETEIVHEINKNHKNPAYLTEVTLPENIRAEENLNKAVSRCDLALFATPSHAIRELAEHVKNDLNKNCVIVSIAKGIEKDTFMTPSQILVQVLENRVLEDQVGVLSGPSHAEEVGTFKPTTVVAAAYSKRVAGIIQKTFMTPMLRVYTNNDILGVEIGGAVKNVMAIAAGVVDGAELGDNAKAALITRGLHEMKRMGTHMGASRDTFSGLTGMGDLIVTCTSKHSRNRYVGYRIGKGENLDDITSGMNMIAEGIKTTMSVSEWARKNKVEMPITEAVRSVLFEGVNPKDALYKLMTRNPKEEVLI